MRHEPDPHPPSTLGRYLLLRPLGAGGMAETFVAVRACPERPGEPLEGEPEVCLKRLRAELAADPIQRGHFADEARTLARLCHPNVAGLVDVGPDHLVTELIDGVDLRRLLAFVTSRGERLPEPLVVRVAHELAEALAHAHARSVVHRDVTPANVVIGRDGRVTLVDFGIARSEAQRQRTRTGLVKGKAPYMAPEQALGAPIDARTDLFALGVVLFEMLVGVRPHDGASDLETLRHAMRGERRSWGEHPPDAALRTLVERMLAPDPRDRPASAEEVRRALVALPRGAAEGLGAWARATGDAPPPRARRPERETRSGRAAPGDHGASAELEARAETATVAEESIPTREDPALSHALQDEDAPGSELLGSEVLEVRTGDTHVVEQPADEVRSVGAHDRAERVSTSANAGVAPLDEATAVTERDAWLAAVGPVRPSPVAAVALGVMLGGSAGAVAAALWHWLP